MDRDVGVNAVEKHRIREVIADQVQQYLQRGGRITVVQTPQANTKRTTNSGTWAGIAEGGEDPIVFD